MAVTSMEPVLLLVGKTGVGKTTSDQFLAEETGRNLKVINNNHTAHVTLTQGGAGQGHQGLPEAGDEVEGDEGEDQEQTRDG